MVKKQKKTNKAFNWGVAVGLLLAFLAGGVIGAVVERERVLNARDENAAAPAQSAAWFSTVAACAPLRRWTASGAAADAALLGGAADWGASRATLVQQSSEGRAALQSLLPLGTPTGRAEIQSLIAHEDKVRAALTKASSVEEFAASLEKLDSERTTQGKRFLAGSAGYCPPG
jgi:hypothetical protein